MKNELEIAPLRTRIGRAWWLPLLFLLATVAMVKAGDFTYTTNADNTLTITRYTGTGGSMIIPSVIDGKTVASIGDDAFSGFSSLTNVTIPNSVTNIGDDAFGFTGLANVTIPNSVISIGGIAFGGCKSLTSVTIPNSVTSIGVAPFDGCTRLAAIMVDAGNSAYGSVAGVLFNKSQTELVEYPGGKAGDYAIPNSVTNIKDWAFALCPSLTSVTIPNSAISIGSRAFWGCDSLPIVTIPNSVVSIGDNAFSACYSLTSVTIGNGMTRIRYNAFSGCFRLTGIYFTGNAPSLGDAVFYGADDVVVYYLQGTTGWYPAYGGRPTLPWIPLITANGLIGDVHVNMGNPVKVDVQTLNLGHYLGIDVDWWIIARAGSAWYYLSQSGQWTQFDGLLSHCHPAHQGELFNLPVTTVLNTTGLQTGSYTFWFAIDYPMDGILNIDGQISIHSVNVTVQ